MLPSYGSNGFFSKRGFVKHFVRYMALHCLAAGRRGKGKIGPHNSCCMAKESGGEVGTENDEGQ